MKVHRLIISVIDFDGLGAEGVRAEIESAHYPNSCINPRVVSVETSDIGEWDDSHPLNHRDKHDAAFSRLFDHLDKGGGDDGDAREAAALARLVPVAEVVNVPGDGGGKVLAALKAAPAATPAQHAPTGAQVVTDEILERLADQLHRRLGVKIGNREKPGLRAALTAALFPAEENSHD